MGLGKLLSFVRVTRNGAKLSDVKLDPGGGPNITAAHFSPPGDDSYPLPGDYVARVAIQRSGGSAVVGYLDPGSDQKAQAGDKRIYSRDTNGASIAELWLKNDGSILASNGNGSINIAADGSMTVTGTTVTVNADTVNLGGTGGGGVITTESVDPFTGAPHIDGSTKVKAVKS